VTYPSKNPKEKEWLRWFFMLHQAKMWHCDDLASSLGRVLCFPLWRIIEPSQIAAFLKLNRQRKMFK